MRPDTIAGRGVEISPAPDPAREAVFNGNVVREGDSNTFPQALFHAEFQNHHQKPTVRTTVIR